MSFPMLGIDARPVFPVVIIIITVKNRLETRTTSWHAKSMCI